VPGPGSLSAGRPPRRWRTASSGPPGGPNIRGFCKIAFLRPRPRSAFYLHGNRQRPRVRTVPSFPQRRAREAPVFVRCPGPAGSRAVNRYPKNYGPLVADPRAPPPTPAMGPGRLSQWAAERLSGLRPRKLIREPHPSAPTVPRAPRNPAMQRPRKNFRPIPRAPSRSAPAPPPEAAALALCPSRPSIFVQPGAATGPPRFPPGPNSLILHRQPRAVPKPLGGADARLVNLPAPPRPGRDASPYVATSRRE